MGIDSPGPKLSAIALKASIEFTSPLISSNESYDNSPSYVTKNGTHTAATTNNDSNGRDNENLPAIVQSLLSP